MTSQEPPHEAARNDGQAQDRPPTAPGGDPSGGPDQGTQEGVPPAREAGRSGPTGATTSAEASRSARPSRPAGESSDTEAPRPQRPARGHGEAEATAPVRLTAREEALAKLLPSALEAFDPVIGADIDEVTCRVPRESVAEACGVLKSDPRLGFDYLRLLTVVDYVAADHEFEAVYHVYSLERRHKMVVKARAPEADPWFPSVTGVWRGADWYEREMRDLFGVDFRGHPDFRPLILPDDFEGFPGRKAYPLYEYDEF